MTIPTLMLAESTGTALLARLGVKSIAEARKLDEGALQAAAGAGPWRPVADGHVLSNDLGSLYSQGKFNDTPVLLGHTSDETLVFGGPKSLTPADFEKQIRSDFGAQADAVLKAYPHASEADALKAMRYVRNDSSFAWNAWTWARQQTRHGKGKVYTYYFDTHAPQAEGSGHGSDVPFVFQTLAGRRTPSAEDLALSDQISSYFVNFAKTGDPNGGGLPQWPAFNEQNPRVMVFEGTPRVRINPVLNKVKLFDPYFVARSSR
jgi:para-nitrobenzyl esterase